MLLQTFGEEEPLVVYTSHKPTPTKGQYPTIEWKSPCPQVGHERAAVLPGRLIMDYALLQCKGQKQLHHQVVSGPLRLLIQCKVPCRGTTWQRGRALLLPHLLHPSFLLWIQSWGGGLSTSRTASVAVSIFCHTYPVVLEGQQPCRRSATKAGWCLAQPEIMQYRGRATHPPQLF